MMKKTLRGPDGVTLELDSGEIYPDDPGNGTPAMVCKGGGFGSLTCVECTGEIYDSRIGDVQLSARSLDWLASEKVQNMVESMYAAGRNGNF